ncbi:Gfo/Idh/MocA family oxidoreductase (plasmid) [Peteryoungia desertarenae]|uniref:Gfo/Idh/MocA family oxidoreductase n=1 Tax=Peteryoungia desertarenae TaxID=1813451 RepID=A0ABX6QTS7_9HYPH|nr:Gfo/Idh/MocA family oxidoreductase [Peteryoungia desertarenae]QLF71848.1 Gfo/Idh/MocA family oxidoreductase [Peteryoungia desertarenae]
MRWALIGASTIARQYMIGAIRAEHGEISHVLSASAERARAFAAEHHISASATDLDTLLADPEIDAVYISTTNEKHLLQALAALHAGKHVLCEKPLALAVDHAVAMVRAAKKAGLVFATNHHLRCSGSHRAVRELIMSGRIGKVLSLRLHHAVFLPPHLQGWRISSPESGGGVIPDITVHDADVARFLLGEDPVSVVAQMTSSGLGNGVEDSAMSVWTMPSGAMVMSHESFTHPFAGSGLEVHGTQGSIFARDVMTQNPIGSVELVTGSGRQTIAFEQHDLYREGVRRFQAAVAGEGEPAATGLDGVKSLAVALAVRDAAERGVRIAVNYGDMH